MGRLNWPRGATLTRTTFIPALTGRLPGPAMRTGGQAGAVVAARLVGAGANVATVLVLSRTMTPTQTGLVLAGLAGLVLGELLALLGREAVAIQVLPQALASGDRTRAAAFARGLLRQGGWGAPLAGLAVAGALWLASGGAAAPAVLALAGLGVLPAAALRALARTVMAMGGVALGAGFSMAARPVLLLLGVAALARAGALGPATAFAAALAAGSLATLGLALAARGRLRILAGPAEGSDPAWRRSGLALLPTMLMTGELPSLAILLAGLVMAEAQVALFGIAARLAGLMGLGTAAMVAALGPRLSAAWRGGAPAAQRVGRTVPRVTVPLALLGALLVWAAAPRILAAFGPDYPAGAWALRVLALAPLATACAGPSLLALTAAGAAGQGARAALASVPVVAAGVLLGGLAGAAPAACGVLLGVVVWEAGLAVRLRRRTGLSLWLPFGPRAP